MHQPSNGTILRRLRARLARVERLIVRITRRIRSRNAAATQLLAAETQPPPGCEENARTMRGHGDSIDPRPGGLLPPRPLGFVLARLAIASIALFAGGGRLFAQAPDCVQFFTLTAVTDTGTVDNRQTGCANWTMVYESEGFSAISLVFQSAPGATTPGTFVTYSGTVVSGSNPATNTTLGTTVFNGYVGWWRVRLDSVTGSGTVRGSLYGYRTGFSSLTPPTPPGSSCAGTVGTPCVVDGPDASGAAPTKSPVLTAGFDGTNVERIRTDTTGRSITDPLGAATAQADGATNTPTIPFANGVAASVPSLPYKFNGATWDRDLKCSLSVIIDDSTMGNTQIIALSGSTVIRVCKLTLTSASSVSIQLTQGTGSNCGTGTANLSFLYQNAVSIAEDYLSDQSLLIGTAANALCLNLSGAVRTTGQIWYDQF